MSRRLLLPIALALAVVTPVLAEDPPAASTDSVVSQANQAKARAEALKAQYEAQKAEVEARFAPISQFAGDGQTQLNGENAGQMEGAYLAAGAIHVAAEIVDDEVQRYLVRADARQILTQAAHDLGRTETPRDPVPEPLRDSHWNDDAIILVAKDETISFDHVAAFDFETDGLIDDFNSALGNVSPATCVPHPVLPPPRMPEPAQNPHNFMLGGVGFALAGELISVLQSHTTIQGLTGLGDETLLLNALSNVAGGRYVLQSAILTPTLRNDDRIYLRLRAIDACRTQVQTRVAGLPDGDQKTRLNAVLQRAQSFHDAMFKAGDGGAVPIVEVYRESLLRDHANPFILQLRVDRAGGTLITEHNLWTALGVPGVVLSGGVVVSYRLFDRSSGRLATGGVVICRTPAMALTSAMSLQRTRTNCRDSAGTLRRYDDARQPVQGHERPHQ